MATVISIKVTEEQLKRASELYSFGALKNSITKGKSNIYGAIGEVIVHDYLSRNGITVKWAQTADHDLKYLVEESNGAGANHFWMKADVKTKRTTVPPLPSFSCSIPAHNTTQMCDEYIFVRVHEDKTHGWILGRMYKTDYFKKAKFFRVGQKDPKFPAFKFKGSCYNLDIGKLNEIKC